jgi:hypothetical protein
MVLASLFTDGSCIFNGGGCMSSVDGVQGLIRMCEERDGYRLGVFIKRHSAHRLEISYHRVTRAVSSTTLFIVFKPLMCSRILTLFLGLEVQHAIPALKETITYLPSFALLFCFSEAST